MPKTRVWPWIVLLVVVLLFLGGLVAGSVWIKGFLRSEDFRRLVADKTGAALRAEADFAPLNWTGSSVFSDQMTAAGQLDSPVKSLRADQVRAEVNWRAIWDGAWRVDSLNVGYLEGSFRQPAPAEVKTEHLSTPPPSGLWSLLPRRFELGVLNVAQGRLAYLDAAGLETVVLQDSALQIRPDGEGWIIDGERGSLRVPKLPVLAVDSFRSRLQKGAFFLTDARLRLGDQGKINAAGEFGGNSELRVNWQQVDVGAFLEPEWRKRLSGSLNGDGLIKWTGGQAGPTATGQFTLRDGLLQNIATLDQIATFTGQPQFRRMPIQQFSGNYQWAGGQLALTNVVAESKGLMRLEGACVIGQDGALQGQMRVGVTPQTLQWLPGSRERVFTKAENGYLWTDVRIAGTLHSPQEDLSARLAAAMRNEIIDQGSKVIEKLPNAAKDGAKQALDILLPLIQ